MPSAFLKLVKVLLWTGAAVTVLFVVALGTWIYSIDRKIPTRASVTAYFDGVERASAFVDASTLPGYVTGAVISSVDPGFREFRPIGVDLQPCCRGAIITIQVARQIFLNERRESGGVTGWYRRVPLLTAKLEWVAPKKRILNAYLNEVYVGKGHYGIRAAAQLYIGKAPAELDIPQAAFIAAVTRAPGRICRSTGREWALSQRNQIIDRMIVDGILTASSGETARAAPLVVKGCFGNDAAALGR